MPLPFLTDFLRQPEQEVTFDGFACLRNRLNTCGCKRCLEACTANAVRLDGRSVLFSPEQCTACLRCIAVCPNDAFATDFGITRETDRFQKNQGLLVSCNKQRQQEVSEMVVPCLGILSTESILFLAAAGFPSIRFVIEACDECRNQPASISFQKDLHHLIENRLPFVKAAIHLQRGSGNGSVTGNRRSYLAKMRQALATAVIEKPAGSTEPPALLTGRRRRITRKSRLIREMIATADNDERDEIIEYCTPRLTIGEACITCPRCTGICPTGALKFEQSGKGKKLLFNRQSCSACGLCVDFCKHEALSIKGPVFCSPRP